MVLARRASNVSRETLLLIRNPPLKVFHVKHSVDDILTHGRAELELSIPDDRWAALADAIAWQGPLAQQMGLTNYPDLAEYTSNLIVPLLPLLQSSLDQYLLSPALDFGAGSGAAGLSLAILRPDLQVVLADRRARVVQFLDLCSRRLHLSNCSTLQADLASPPTEWRHVCGTVLIRAFGPTDLALKHAAQLMRPDGAIALWHQPPSPAPPADLRQAHTLQTSVPALALTIYDRVG